MTRLGMAVLLALFAVNGAWADPAEDTHGTLDLKVAVQDELGIDTVSEVVELHHVKASQLEPFIRARLSRWGAVQVDDALNMVIITDKKLKLRDLAALVRTLDSPTLKDFVRLDTVAIPLRFTDPSIILASVTSQLSPEGRIVVDAAHNALVVTDLSSRLEALKAFVGKLDAFVPQAVMEVSVVQVNNDFMRNAGLDWSVLNTINGSFSANGGTNSNTSNNTYSNSAYNNYASSGSGSNNGWNASGNINVSSFLNLITNNNKGKVLLTTRLTGTNGTQVRFTSGLGAVGSVATYSGNANANSALPQQGVPEADRQDGFSVVVQPRVGAGDVATLNVQVGMNNFLGWDNSGRPLLDSRSLNTQAVLRDGDTLLLGGLQKVNLVDEDKGIPGLRTVLPFIFSRQSKARVESDLLVLLTVHVQRDFPAAPDADTQRGLQRLRDSGLLKPQAPLPSPESLSGTAR